MNVHSSSVDNHGTIDAIPGGNRGFSITSDSGGSFTNDGTLEATAGGHLNLDGTWTNNPGHMISVTGSTVAFNDTWSNRGTLASQGAVCCLSQPGRTLANPSVSELPRLRRQRTILLLGGSLNRSGKTLDSSAGPGKWVLNNTTISGGTIATTIDTNDRNTVYYTETTRLQDVTLTGTIQSHSNDSLNIMGSGLTLSGGTVRIDNGGRLNFSGTQSLLGTGTVSFTEGSINVTSSGRCA